MTTNGLCYCEAPFIDRALPKFMVDRAHLPRPECGIRVEVNRPEWLRRKDRGLLPAKELTR